MLGIDPLQVRILPLGSIERYRRSINHTLFKVNPNFFDVTEILKIAATNKGGEPYC